jgi:DNA helicase HerA-like ATPase
MSDEPGLWERIRARSDDRYLVLGDSGSGKSYFADRIRSDYQTRYRAPALIVDSKPEYAPGRDWHRRNRGWLGMKDLPDAVLVETPQQLEKLLRDKAPRTYVVQGGREEDYPRLMAVAEAFYADSQGRPRILHVDECMDFFHANGVPKRGADILRRTARSARARNCAVIYCAQRTRGFHADIRSEMSKAAFFALLNRDDQKIARQFGLDFEWPEEDHAFMFWTRAARNRVYGPYRLAPPVSRERAKSVSASGGTR